MKNFLIILSGFGIVMFVGSFHPASALPSQGTSAGTIITAVSTNLEILYEDPNSNVQPTVNASSDVTTSVSAIYGLDQSGFTVDTQKTILAGNAASYEVYFRNVANTTDLVSFNYNTVSINYTGSFGSSWALSPLSADSANLTEFAVATISFTVTASPLALNGAKGYVTVNALTDSTPVGTYTGFNNNSYGGPPTLNYVTVTTVSGPDIVIVTKNLILVTAPTANGYNGAETDAVPGSKLQYQIVLKNQGVTANTVSLEQAIPLHTDYLRGSMVITGTAAITPVKEYFNGSYVTDSGSTTDAGVSKIRFRFTEMSTGPSYVTLNYTVVVE